MRKTFVVVALSCLTPCLGCGDDSEEPIGSGGTAGSPTTGGAGGSKASGGAGGSTASGGSAGSSGGRDPGNSLCEQGCMATLEAACDNGPATQAQCEADCETQMMGACGTEYQALQACADGETVSCGPMGIPVIEACAPEQTAFIDCLN